MLEKPDIPDELLIASLEGAFGLQASELTFLPLGADANTAVYRFAAQDGVAYFLKLRKGSFDEISVTLPGFLQSRGLRQVIAPVATRSGQLWAEVPGGKLIVYPFIAGRDAYEVNLTDTQWVAFGAAVKAIHQAQLPPALLQQIPHEWYDPRWRTRVKHFQLEAEAQTFDDPVAARLAEFMRLKRARIDYLLQRAERLASELQTRPLEHVLCHSDLHAGNLLLCPDGMLYIVDWDNPILAPKEHDLMHIGASERWMGRRIKSLFFRGYGEAQVDGMAISYYRCERILRDIAEFCSQLLSTHEGGKDREQSLGYFTRQFDPGQEVEIACRGEGDPKMTVTLCFSDRIKTKR